MQHSLTRLRRAVQIIREEGIRTFFEASRRFAAAYVLRSMEQRERTRALYERFFDAQGYWEHRYKRGGQSGPGSVGEHAQFKADFVNGFVAEHDVDSVIEFGCGDGEQLALAEYPDYVGLDVSESAVERCEERFADDPTKRFRTYDPFDDVPRFGEGGLTADLSLSMEVVFHLVDDRLFEQTMADIFGAAEKYVIIFSSNRDENPSEIHVRHRKFTEYVDETFPQFELIETKENPFEERVSDFYVYERASA